MTQYRAQALDLTRGLTKAEQFTFEREMLRGNAYEHPEPKAKFEYRPTDGPRPCGSGSSYIPTTPEDCQPVDLRELQRLEEQVRR